MHVRQRQEVQEVLRRLELALEVARKAGAHALSGFRGRMQVTEKARADLVTEWDVATEKLIRELLAAGSDIGVVGEELGGARPAGPVWYADPIDGTTNYVHGHPFWCVSIGLAEAGEPVLGAVVAPALGWEWWGTSTGPSFFNGAECRVSSTEELSESLLATGFPRSRPAPPNDNFGSFESVKQVSQGVRRCGSAAIDLCMVADGTYDGYWERLLNAWDLTAGAAIVLGAGGRLSALDGGPARIDTGALVASNGRIHDALVGRILR